MDPDGYEPGRLSRKAVHDKAVGLALPDETRAVSSSDTLDNLFVKTGL